MSTAPKQTVLPYGRSEFLSFSPPTVGEAEIAAVVDVLRSGWLSRGPKTAEFESAFADSVGADDALALNSCTAGLHLALRVLDIGPGDEVIAPTVTFSASVNVIEHVGARPVLVDVEEETLNIDPDAVERAITPQTKAIVVVHYGGHPAEMTRLQEIADAHGLAIIEDAAHALPATYRASMIGGSGNLTAFSFYATKNLTTGEGGMLTGPKSLVERARVLSLHGMSGDAWSRYTPGGKWAYEVVEPGYKYNMTDIQAALGLIQLNRLMRMQIRRRQIVVHYEQGFGDLDCVALPIEREHVSTAWHLYPIRLLPNAPVKRNAFIDRMKDLNIGTSVHFIPVHMHPYYAQKYGYGPGSFPVAERVTSGIVSLPMHAGLTDDEAGDVVAAVRHVLRR